VECVFLSLNLINIVSRFVMLYTALVSCMHLPTRLIVAATCQAYDTCGACRVGGWWRFGGRIHRNM